MPLYPGPGKAPLLHENNQAWLFQNEAVTAGQASIAYQLERARGVAYPFGASFEISFSADPGAFEVDIQTSDSDAATGKYFSVVQTTGPLNASFVTRIEMPLFWARYVRVILVSITNAVNLTVELTR